MTSLRARLEQILHPGYSTCGRCERPWATVKPHDTPYGPNRGCFPLCEVCWTELAIPELRWPYYVRLWESWQGCGISETHGPEALEGMREAVFEGL